MLPSIELALGESIAVVRQRSHCPFRPLDSLRDDDGEFLPGPLLITYRGADGRWEFPPAGLAAVRWVAGRVVHLDLNPHLTGLPATALGPLLDRLADGWTAAGGFLLPTDEAKRPEVLKAAAGEEHTLGLPPWGLNGLVGADAFNLTVRRTGDGRAGGPPPFALQVTVYNPSVLAAAEEEQRAFRRAAGGDPKKWRKLTDYPRAVWAAPPSFRMSD